IARRPRIARGGSGTRTVGEYEELAEVRLVLLGHPFGLGFPALVAHGGIVEAAVAAGVQVGGAVRTFVLAQNHPLGGDLLAALEAGAHPPSAAEYSRLCYH